MTFSYFICIKNRRKNMLNITIITNDHNLIENLFNEITFNLFDKYRVIKM